MRAVSGAFMAGFLVPSHFVRNANWQTVAAIVLGYYSICYIHLRVSGCKVLASPPAQPQVRSEASKCMYNVRLTQYVLMTFLLGTTYMLSQWS